jgi:metal-responsive CopG/Arc/MetJ family transcriptional regulator
MTDSPEPKDKRVPLVMTASELKAIDDWSFERRIRSRSEAIRQLVALGLKASAEEQQVDEESAASLLAREEGLRASKGKGKA